MLRIYCLLFTVELILGSDMLHKLGKISNFENKTNTWQEVSILMKPPNCMAKEFFVIKECRPVRNTSKRIKQNLDAEYKQINLKTIIMNLNHLKDKHKFLNGLEYNRAYIDDLSIISNCKFEDHLNKIKIV